MHTHSIHVYMYVCIGINAYICNTPIHSWACVSGCSQSDSESSVLRFHLHAFRTERISVLKSYSRLMNYRRVFFRTPIASLDGSISVIYGGFDGAITRALQ